MTSIIQYDKYGHPPCWSHKGYTYKPKLDGTLWHNVYRISDVMFDDLDECQVIMTTNKSQNSYLTEDAFKTFVDDCIKNYEF